MTAPLDRQYWLLKSEPEEFSWEDQTTKDNGVAKWDGVRNAVAQKNMRSMRMGDLCFFYHSGTKWREVVGIVTVCDLWEPEEGAAGENGKFGFVRVRAVMAVPKPVSLHTIKEQDGKSIHDFILLRQQRLSVVPVSAANWDAICNLGEVDKGELSKKILESNSATGAGTAPENKGSGSASEARVKVARVKGVRKEAASKVREGAKATAKPRGKKGEVGEKQNGVAEVKNSQKQSGKTGKKKKVEDGEEPTSEGRKPKATVPKAKEEDPVKQSGKRKPSASNSEEEKPASQVRKRKPTALKAKEEKDQGQEAPRGRRDKGSR